MDIGSITINGKLLFSVWVFVIICVMFIDVPGTPHRVAWALLRSLAIGTGIFFYVCVVIALVFAALGALGHWILWVVS